MECRFVTSNLHIYVIIIFGAICATVEPRYISNADENYESTMRYEPTMDCLSPNLTIDQLKAMAHIHCSDNEDRRFWEAACSCALKQIPESECPKCRVSRNVGHGLSSSNNRSTLLTTSTSPKPTTVDNELMNKKLRLFSNSSSTVSNSANFIRFGK